MIIEWEVWPVCTGSWSTSCDGYRVCVAFLSQAVKDVGAGLGSHFLNCAEDSRQMEVYGQKYSDL